jgi:hypothetical protein
MDVSLEDNVFGFLLRQALPLVVAPAGSRPPGDPRLRGVVRSALRRARVILSRDPQMLSGIGFEFDLVDDEAEISVDGLIDWLRFEAPGLGHTSATDDAPIGQDAHSNSIFDANRAGFSSSSVPVSADNNLFSMLSIFVHGGGFPWFDDIYSCMGFMRLGNDACRVYIRGRSQSDKTVGLDIPLRATDGKIRSGMGGNFPQEIASLVSSDTLQVQPRSPLSDEYCEYAFEMAKWVDPLAGSV